MNILYQFDDYFAPIAGVSMTSLFENNRHIPEMNVYIMDGGISGKNRDLLRELSIRYQRPIHYIDGKSIDRALEERGVKKWRNSYAAYYKVYAVGQIEDDIDRLLSLDGDTIIHGKIDPLYFAELDGKTLGMAQDFMPPAYLERIGIDNDERYFNSGVILYDVPRWKETRCQERIESFFADETRNYLFVEQDALNALFPHEIQRLSIEFNYYAVFSALKELLSLDLDTLYHLYGIDKLCRFYSLEELCKAEQDAIVYHFEGGTVAGRPWEKGTSGTIFALWDRYRAISPWKDMEKQEPRETEFHRIEKKLNRILPSSLFLTIYEIAFNLYWKRLLQKHPEKQL